MPGAGRNSSPKPSVDLRSSIAQSYLADETELVHGLANAAELDAAARREVEALARGLVQKVRAGRRQAGGIDEFLHEYALSSEEGIVLMCLAEALLRIPDAATADRLIADRIAGRDWRAHIGKSGSLFVNASTWGLMLTGDVVELGAAPIDDVFDYLGRLVARSGEPIIRQAMRHAMRIMGRQFVLGRSIEEAVREARPWAEKGYRFSFDMLGEAAMTAADAERYFSAYRGALEAIFEDELWRESRDDPVAQRPSISVKLSALHPRFEPMQAGRAVPALVTRLCELSTAAEAGNVGLTIDAEEADRLDITLDVFDALLKTRGASAFEGIGLAVQAYGRRAMPILEWLSELSRRHRLRIPVRLVKGAYWDSEIKRAQKAGLASYPVFTRKSATDVSYLACAQYLINNRDRFHPQFATHNAHSVASVWVRNAGAEDIEFQRLYGMGQALYGAVSEAGAMGAPCRIYAPVGSHEDLLAYLVRRLLENGANTSFVHRLADDEAPIRDIIADPVETVRALDAVPDPRILQPPDLFVPDRVNSRGLLLGEPTVREPLLSRIKASLVTSVNARPLVAGEAREGRQAREVRAPHDRGVVVGMVCEATDGDIADALAQADAAQPAWDRFGGAARAEVLEHVARLYEDNAERLMALIMAEAGKTLANAHGDLREAVDFLNYYAAAARRDFSGPKALPGPTGERNRISLHGRGAFVCISPWNFPIAIFTGQIAGALAAGNAVIAKPAEQTPLVAHEAVRLMHSGGVPRDIVHYLPGDGARVGGGLIADRRCAGVAFTGGIDTARQINRSLAAREGPIVPFVAETGGLNAMIVDSTALPEQVVGDALRSAFDSAGQRCSALRVLCLQEEIATRVIGLLAGAMDELVIGDPFEPVTDVGPVIDDEARSALEAHKATMRSGAKVIRELVLPAGTQDGTFVAPAAYEIGSPDELHGEVFGPVLHVLRYRADRLDQLIEAINRWGYGLTLAIHSRIERSANAIAEQVLVGNVYINQTQIGAVVGAQPFGGEGLSGTGPKAGGPFYLNRFATERVVSTDTTASGGNAALMSMGPDIHEG